MRILYVDIDTLRPDHLGCYGYPRDTSPNIDAVARQAVRFTDYYCSDAPCLPSRAALMTGRFGIHTGCVGHGGINAEMRPEGRDRGMADFNGRYNLPAVLRRAGMKTATISSFPDRHAAWWFNGGFDECYNVGKRGLEPAHEVIPLALDWLDRKRETKDWFLHLHVWDPHIPYRTPESYGKPFADDPLPDPWMTRELLDHHRRTKPGGHSACEVTGYDNAPNPAAPRQITEIKDLDDFKAMVDEYDTGIWYADRQLGQVFQKLKEQGIYEDTAIIISSDHGEDLGELGSYCEHGEAEDVYKRQPYLCVTASAGQLHFLYLMPFQGAQGAMRPLELVLAACTVLVLVAIPVMWAYLRRTVFRPLDSLVDTCLLYTSALQILLVALSIIFVLVTASLYSYSVFSAHQAQMENPTSVVSLVALLICLAPTTIGALLSAIGIAGMSRLNQANVLAMSGRAIEAAGDTDVLLLDKSLKAVLYSTGAANWLVYSPRSYK